MRKASAKKPSPCLTLSGTDVVVVVAAVVDADDDNDDDELPLSCSAVHTVRF